MRAGVAFGERVSGGRVRAPALGLRQRCSAYVEVAKPRITLMALFAVVVGYVVGSQGRWDLRALANVFVGLAAVATSCHVLNQWIERAIDARMRRTWHRPLPTRRLHPREALAFGLVSAVFGLLWLMLHCPTATVLLAATTLVTYVGIYTPLKRRTPLSVVVGAVPGALPPVIGWSVGGDLNAVTAALFGMLFLWQVPHVMSIAWLYRNDYRTGGLRMIPADGGCPECVGWVSVVYCVALFGVSLLPRWFGVAGELYVVAAAVTGIQYAIAALAFACGPSDGRARMLLRSSLWYLPVAFGSLALEHIWWLVP